MYAAVTQFLTSANVKEGYTIDAVRFFTSLNPIKVLHAEHTPSHNEKVDRRTTASFALPNDITASITCDLGMPSRFGFIPAMPSISAKVDCEGGKLELYNFVLPTVYHYLSVEPRGKKGRVEKIYKGKEGSIGEEWWTTYRFQLEEFINRVKGRKVDVWMGGEESVEDIKWIEEVYKVGGFGSRPKSAYVL
jgi:predicted dehydrogenase